MVKNQPPQLNVIVVNECVMELETSELPLTNTGRMLRDLWIAEAYSNMHASWQGMDDKEAWAA